MEKLKNYGILNAGSARHDINFWEMHWYSKSFILIFFNFHYQTQKLGFLVIYHKETAGEAALLQRSKCVDLVYLIWDFIVVLVLATNCKLNCRKKVDETLNPLDYTSEALLPRFWVLAVWWLSCCYNVKQSHYLLKYKT